MIVVSNTSPLTNLAAIGQFHLLGALYTTVHIPLGVWDDLNAFGQAWPGSREAAEADWVIQHAVADQTLVTALQDDLHRGEAETIALAIELKADLVLLDEKDARQRAKKLGLVVGGVLGILLQAKARGLLPTVRPALDDLRQRAGFYVSDPLYRHILVVAQE